MTCVKLWVQHRFILDWLDDSCRLRYSINEASAIEFAESALDVLTKFGLLAFEEYFKLLSELISNWNVEDMKGKMTWNNG